MNRMAYGVDIAEAAMQVYPVETEPGDIEQRTLCRGERAAFTANRLAGRVAIMAGARVGVPAEPRVVARILACAG
jgi:hypothetical protein